MRRRDLIGAAGVTLLGGGAAVGTVLGVGPLASEDSSKPWYLGRASVVYERDRLRLSARQDAVRRGDTITFEITHIGDSEPVSLGCNVWWAIQTYEDDEWRHAVWTDGRFHQLCASEIGSGRTLTEKVPLSRTALAEHRGITESNTEFTPGKYRFVLVGSEPYLAVNFRVLPS
jgi:hypothetical protein